MSNSCAVAFGSKCPVIVKTPTGAIFGNHKTMVWDIDDFTHESFLPSFYAEDFGARLVAVPTSPGGDMPKEATIFDAASNGVNSHVRDGKRSVTLELRDGDANFAATGQINGLRCECNPTGVMIPTKDNKSLMYKEEISIAAPPYKKTVLKLIPIISGSVTTFTMAGTDAGTQKAMLTFDLDPNIDESKFVLVDFNRFWSTVASSIVGFNINYDLPIISNTVIDVSQVTTSTATFTVNTVDRNGQINPADDKGNAVGLTLANFLVTNVTNVITPNTPVAALAITEASPGVYEASWTAVTSGDVLRVDLLLSGGSNPINFIGTSDFATP